MIDTHCHLDEAVYGDCSAVSQVIQRYAEIESVIDTDEAKQRAIALYEEYKANMQNERKTIEKSIKAFLKKASKKDKRFLDVGFCGNPISMGSCPGDDLTQETLDWIVKHKKSKNIILKALR